MKATKLPSGSWRAQAYDKNTKKRRSFTADTKKEAERQANLWLLTHKESCSITFGAALDSYIEAREKTRSVTTVREYKRYREKYYGSLLPVLIENLTDRVLQDFVTELSADKSAKTVINIFNPVKTVIRIHDPARVFHVPLPKKERPDIYIPTEEEVKKLIGTAGGTDMEIPVLLAAFCTMRRGEISALQAEDIINGTIHVKASLADAGGGVWIRKAPKSYAGNRYITCPAFILDLLPKHGPVTPLNPDSITHGMERLVRRSGVHDMHFHCLRHYCASQMIAHGIPISDVKKIGGWDSQALEQIYMHSLEESRKKSDAIWMKFSDGFLNDCTQQKEKPSK